MRTCTKCKKEKNKSEFYKKKDGKNGLHSQCKSCKNAYNKQWDKENPEKVLAKSKRYRERHPERAKESMKKWGDKNKERKRENWKRWSAANKERRREYMIKRSQTAAGTEGGGPPGSGCGAHRRSRLQRSSTGKELREGGAAPRSRGDSSGRTKGLRVSPLGVEDRTDRHVR